MDFKGILYDTAIKSSVSHTHDCWPRDELECRLVITKMCMTNRERECTHNYYTKPTTIHNDALRPTHWSVEIELMNGLIWKTPGQA